MRDNETTTTYRGRAVHVLARDTDPTCFAWVYFLDDPDHDLFVSPADLEQDAPAHPGPFAHGRSGLIYCTACLASAADLGALQTAPCYANNYED